MYGQVPEWYWKSEKHRKIKQEEYDFKRDNPCLCFEDPENPPRYSQCYCVDGETVIDFCKEHGGDESESAMCLCCRQLPAVIIN